MVLLGFMMTILSALIFPGVIIVIKSKLVGRKGPAVWQPIFDAVRLLRKGNVYSNTASAVFQLAPIINLASVLMAALFIPFGNVGSLLSFEGDFIFFISILATGRFLMIIGAMDIGSGFEGMGANREALYSMLLEPALFILMGSMAMLTEHNSFQGIYSHVILNSYLIQMVIVVWVYLLIQIALVENSRIPVDDPATHLELTMVHEVMVLDNSGFDLGLIKISAWIKFAIFGSLIANFLFSSTLPLTGQIMIFFFIQIVFATLIGTFETFRPRNKVARNPQWILTLSAISLIVFLASLIISHKYIIT